MFNSEYDNTSHLGIEFYLEPVKNEKKSAETGRPIFEDKEYVKIHIAGDRNRVHVAPAHETFARDRETNGWITYAQAFHRHYDAFKSGEQVRGEGTPLGQVDFMTPAKVKEFAALNVHTVEQLAGLEGANLQKLGMYGRQFKEKAQQYIDTAASSNAPLMAENAALKERLEQLEKLLGSGAPAAPAPAPVPEPATSPFADWDDGALKAFIKERTGTSPKGQPGHATLVRLAEEANAKEAA